MEKIVKSYKIELVENEDETLCIRRTVDGFDALEILGLMELAKTSIINQLNGFEDLPTQKIRVTE